MGHDVVVPGSAGEYYIAANNQEELIGLNVNVRQALGVWVVGLRNAFRHGQVLGCDVPPVGDDV